MIYTITLNPALDRTITLESIKYDVSNRIVNEARYAGGKGIDVSKVLAHFEIESIALGFVGGYRGEEIMAHLLSEGISCEFVTISGETRTNLVINEIETGRQLLITSAGPEIRPYEIMRLIRQIEEIRHAEVVVMGGSLPPGVSPEVYRKMIEIIQKNGYRVILDADKEALRIGIKAKPFAIKPNIHELSDLVKKDLQTIEEIRSAAQELHKSGIEIVLVSMGSRGILLADDKGEFHAFSPEVKIENTIGAGDSAIAGFIYGMLERLPPSEAVKYAVAAGTATVMIPGTAHCKKDDMLSILPKVEIIKL